MKKESLREEEYPGSISLKSVECNEPIKDRVRLPPQVEVDSCAIHIDIPPHSSIDSGHKAK